MDTAETDSDAPVLVSERDIISSPDELNDFELSDSNDEELPVSSAAGSEYEVANNEEVEDATVEEEEDFSWHEELDRVLSGDFVDHGIIKFICKCRVVPDRFR